MAADIQTYGFPLGYFTIRSVATGRLLDVKNDDIEDGTEIILWPEKETSLVESRRNPEANNQVFFIDPSGALCSRSSGHAIDIEGDHLVLRHRRPISRPFPNAYAHTMPTFFYSPKTGEIIVNFACDPAYPPPNANTSNAWKQNTYILSSIPMRKPRTIIDNASDFISSAISAPLSFLSGKPPATQATPEEVFSGVIDLHENEVVEQDRSEEGEIDDAPDLIRMVRVLGVVNKDEDDALLSEKARTRRRWQISSLRMVDAKTGA